MADLGLWASYRVLLGSRIRSQLAYRASFVINALSSAGLGIIEFIEIYVILTWVPVSLQRVLVVDLAAPHADLWWDLPLRDSFRILGAIHRIGATGTRRRTDELVERLALGDLLDTPVRQLSLGERMRGEVAAALIHRPRLLVLDEPTIGLDMISKERLRQFLVGERTEHGTTLLLTTHDMSDIERLCERVLVVDHGRLVFDGTLPGLAETVFGGLNLAQAALV